MQFKLPANTPADCISEQSAVLRLCPPLSPFPPETADSADAAVLHQAGIPKQAADAAVQILPAAVRTTAADAAAPSSTADSDCGCYTTQGQYVPRSDCGCR